MAHFEGIFRTMVETKGRVLVTRGTTYGRVPHTPKERARSVELGAARYRMYIAQCNRSTTLESEVFSSLRVVES